jgi:hypothetical protein
MKKNLLLLSSLSVSILTSQLSIAPVTAEELVYKIRLRDAAAGSANQASIFSSGDYDREEWVILTVIDKAKVKVRHATKTKDKVLGFSRWFDHPATLIRICLTDGFDSKDCQIVKGDTALIPQGKSIHEVAIDFKYSEGGALYNRSVQISPDLKPSE